MNKKATIEVQFNWIFVLIAGALILGFFGAMIYNQKNISETRTAIEILSKLDVVFSGSYSSRDTLQKIDVPDMEIDFIYPNYMIGTRTEDLKGRFIFAPSALSGNYIAAWTKTWNLGFDIANFVYLTNPDVKYYIVASPGNSLAQQFNASIERKTQAEEENLIRIAYAETSEDISSDQGYKKIRFIFFNVNPDATYLSQFSSKANKDVTALKIEGDLSLGNITFYKKTGSGASSTFAADGTPVPYIGKELLYGAVFVDNRRAYTYLFEKATEKLNILSLILENRSYSLNDAYLGINCIYQPSLFKDLADFSQDPYNKTAEIAEKIPAIDELSRNLIYSSCALPY